MITGLSVRNFKNLAAVPPADDALVPFGPFNVLIGPNGCGKSSLLQAIDFLRAFFYSSVELYLREREWLFDDLPNLRREGRKISWRVRADLGADAQGRYAGTYDYEVSLQPRRHVGIGEERLRYTPKGSSDPLPLLERDGRRCTFLIRATGERREEAVYRQPCSVFANMEEEQDGQEFPEAMHFRAWVMRFRCFYVLDPRRLREPTYGPGGRLGEAGENLAGCLAALKKASPDNFERLVKRVHDLVPTFTGLSLAVIDGMEHQINQREGDASFNSYQMSDGVLRLLAVASLLYTPDPPSVVLFEEPENGIHPQLVREVVQMLRELTQRKPPNAVQVFLTTHSPYVLDEFHDRPEQVYCMERREPQEGASITRLSDRSQLKTVQREYGGSLGEAWFSGLLGATSRN